MKNLGCIYLVGVEVCYDEYYANYGCHKKCKEQSLGSS